MLVVHHLNNSRSQRVLWLLEELGVPHEVKRYERNAATMLAPDTLKAVHPLGKSPVITDEGRTLAETGLIVEYLLRPLRRRPPGPRQVGRGGQPGAAELAVLAPLCGGFGHAAAAAQAGVRRHAPALTRPAAPRWCAPSPAAPNRVIHRPADPAATSTIGEGQLAASGWFSGADFSAADVMMSFPVEAAGSPGRLWRGPAQPAGLPAAHPRPPGLRSRPGAWRPLRLRLSQYARRCAGGRPCASARPRAPYDRQRSFPWNTVASAHPASAFPS